MPGDYLHGVRVVEVANGARPIRTISTGIIGLVATADDADAATYPVNRPVLIAGNHQAMLAKAGTAGTLKRTLEAILAQVAPVIVVVRVPTETTTAAQDTAVIGTTTPLGEFTGLKALLAANAALGVTPKIIGTPGLDTSAVAAEIAAVCDQLRAFGYVAAQGNAHADAITYRAGLSSKRLMTIWPAFIGQDGAELPATAAALGLRAKLDNDVGWHKVISNTPANGVVGLSKDVSFDLQSPASTANLLNAAQITTLIRHEGFRLWGSRTCSADPQFAFESAVRTNDAIAQSIAEAQFWAMDKPMSRVLLDEIVGNLNAQFRQWKSSGYVIDGEAWSDPAKNTSASLAVGGLSIDYRYTPVPPLENLTLYQSITDEYIGQLLVK